MIKYLFMIILGILPIFSWYFQKHYSKKTGRLKLLLKHWTVRYDDFVLIGFNLFIPFWLNVRLDIFVFVVVLCSFIQVIFHWFWAKCNLENNLIHFYYDKSTKLNGAGWTHMLFSIIQMTLMILWLISTNYNIAFLFSGLFLVVFTSLMFVGAKKINGKVGFEDFVFVTVLLVLVLIKFGFYFY